MWITIGILAIVLVVLFFFEYRLRKPDQLILFESHGKIILRKSRFYPRHFSLTLQKTTYSTQMNIEASAKGNLDIKVRLAVTVAAALNHIPELIRVGGWNSNAVAKAEKELETIIHGIVKEYAERYEIEELSSSKIYDYLLQKVNATIQKLGLDLISLTVQSFEALDSKIADAMRQQESARIMEQTEKLNQQARIHATKAKLKADEEIALLENNLELKKYDLKRSEMEKESSLAQKRIEDELSRKRMRLELDKEELNMLKNSPELLMLTPQAARLAEASQSLKNAKTIVTLSPNDLSRGSELIGMFQQFLQAAVNTANPKIEEKQ
ncbi:MAG: SPFH domain-containing protein [Ignavibacteriaceae bacterium]|jgi:hypothetical protein